MVKTLSAWEARRQFGRVLRDVSRYGDAVIVESHGEPVAAVVPISMLEEWEQERQALFDDMRATAERVNLTEEAAEQAVAEATERVRAQERAQARA